MGYLRASHPLCIRIGYWFGSAVAEPVRQAFPELEEDIRQALLFAATTLDDEILALLEASCLEGQARPTARSR
jgi:hypothetical protein